LLLLFVFDDVLLFVVPLALESVVLDGGVVEFEFIVESLLGVAGAGGAGGVALVLGVAGVLGLAVVLGAVVALGGEASGWSVDG